VQAHTNEEAAPGGASAYHLKPEPTSAVAPAAAFGMRGTVAFWLKLPRTVRRCEMSMDLIESDALSVQLTGQENFAQITLRFGPAMADGQAIIRGLLTHLKAGRWYHVAYTWDGDVPENHFVLDGLDQGTPEPRSKPGVVRGLKPGSGEQELALAGDDVYMTAPQFWNTQLPPRAIAALVRGSGHPRYESEGVNYTDETLSIDDFPDRQLVYEANFADSAELENWVREGGESATIVDGRLKLQTGPSPQEGQHIVFWLKQELPADFLAQWSFKPYDKQDGLAIVFFNARGRGGEDIFDPKLSPRDGEFVDYHSGDLDNYHISYYAGHRGSANLRKNHGFYLAAIGVERIHDAPADTFHDITLLKHRGMIRLAVDGTVAITYDDDGETYGPFHSHPGSLGLRQMLHSWYTEYGDFRAWAI